MREKQEITRKRVWRQLLVLLLAVALLPFAPLQTTRAETSGTESLNIKVQYRQSEARKLWNEINKVRLKVGSGSETGTSSAVRAAVEDLEYNYTLEEKARQRAAEIALRCVAETDENVSCQNASSTAEKVCTAWTTNTTLEEYTKVVDAKYKSVAVGCVSYQNYDYWVAIFSEKEATSGESAAVDREERVEVSINPSYINKREISNLAITSLNMNVGDTYDLSKCTASVQVSGHQPIESAYCPLAGSVSVTSSNTSVVSYNGVSLVANAQGTAEVGISHGGLTYGTIQVSVTQPTIANAVISAITDQNYTGSQICPAVTVTLGSKTLVENIDYTLEYKDNINVGTAFVTAVGKGAYSGASTSAYFRIVTPSITNATISSIADQTYTSNQICPAVTVYAGSRLLREYQDYTVTYANNVSIGTATATISGMGAYTGSRTITFRIVGPNLSSATIAQIPDQLYTGTSIKPGVAVTVNGLILAQDTDYYLTYTNNLNVGTATVIVTGKGNYSGTRTTTFRILSKNLANATVSSIDTQKYTGKAITPEVTVTLGTTVLQKNVDYTLSYSDNRSPGTASIVINGAGTFSGSKTVTFKIAQPSLTNATIKVANQRYDGDEQTPTVTVKVDGVKLVEDEDFEVEYRNNVKVGKATVVVYGLGDYSGTKKGSFVIKPGKVTWRSIKASGSTVQLGWKKASRVDGYEIYRSKSASSGFKKLGTLSKSYNTCKNPNLSKGTYYYKIRSYVTVDGTKYYGTYSNVKKVTVK